MATQDPNASNIGVQLRYRLPGADRDIDLLLVATAEKAEQARSILEDQEPVVHQPELKLAPSAAALVSLLQQIQLQVDADEERMEQTGVANPVAGHNLVASCRIADLRLFGSSPKQVALLLACNTGYYNTDNNPEIFFSRRRFAPAANFYDLAMEGVSA